MSLLSLPNELLLQICGDEVLGKNEVYSLVRTNRRLSALSAPRLLEFAYRDEYCVVALYLAAANGNESMIRLLLDKGSPRAYIQLKPHGEIDNKKCVVDLTGDEKEDVVKHLLEHRGQSTIIDRLCGSPIGVAISSRNTALAKIILEKGGTRPLFGLDPNSERPLTLAVCSWNLDMVKVLVEGGEDIEGHRKFMGDGLSFYPPGPLFFAVRNSAKHIIRYLVEMGAEINRGAYQYPSILDFIVRRTLRLKPWKYRQGPRYKKELEVIALLLELGADPNFLAHSGRTVLDIAENYDKAESMCMLLKSYGAI